MKSILCDPYYDINETGAVSCNNPSYITRLIKIMFVKLDQRTLRSTFVKI